MYIKFSECSKEKKKKMKFENDSRTLKLTLRDYFKTLNSTSKNYSIKKKKTKLLWKVTHIYIVYNFFSTVRKVTYTHNGINNITMWQMHKPHNLQMLVLCHSSEATRQRLRLFRLLGDHYFLVVFYFCSNNFLFYKNIHT